MNPLYVTTSPPPEIEGADAVFQDVAALKEAFGGTDLSIYPLKKPSRWVLPEIMGIHQLQQWSALKRNVDLIHVFQPTLRPIPFLESMGKPIVYTVLTTLRNSHRPPLVSLWNPSKRAVGCLDERDMGTLKNWGIKHSTFIPPGINLDSFKQLEDKRGQEFTLLVGSAPWTIEQFQTKGVYALLDAAVRNPQLKLIFLWRGLHLELLQQNIKERSLEPRVEIINQKVCVSDLLARTHATVVLAEHERIVKAYPHSLIESLCAGRPVMISDCMAMADQVEKEQFGVVLPSLDSRQIDDALIRLQNAYAVFESNVIRSARSLYSIQNMIETYARLYETLKV